MASANHEFTWLSGHPQVTVTRDSHCFEQDLSVAKATKPTPLPRQQVTSPQSPKPVPRVFCRPSYVSGSAASASSSSSTGAHIYEEPPLELESSVFYVARPSASVAGTPVTSTAKVDRSVILEFDPILQKRNSQMESVRLSTFYAETPSLESSPGNDSVESPQTTPSSADSTGSANSLWSRYSLLSLFASAATTSGSERSAKEDVVATAEFTSNSSNNYENSTSQGVVSVVPVSVPPPPKVPKPQPRTRTQVKTSPIPELPPKMNKLPFSLSAVPPAPSSPEVVKTPILVENPFYMFFDKDGAVMKDSTPPNMEPDASDDLSKTEQDDEDEGGAGGSEPPKYPPPPLPPLHVLGESPAPTPFCKPKSVPFIREVTQETNPEAESALDQTDSGKRKIPKPPAYPIYQNLLEISGAKEGVYGKIAKVGAPPLPPRGQQRPPNRFCSLPMPNVAPTSSESIMSDNDAADSSKDSGSANELVQRLRNVPHRGVLFKIGRGRKDVIQKWLVLERGHFQCYINDKTDIPQEIYHKSEIISIAKGSDAKYGHQELCCFELVTHLCKDKPVIFGARYLSERDGWIQHLIQSIAPEAAMMNGRDVNKAGFVDTRSSVTSSWQLCWLQLTGNELSIIMKSDSELVVLDLRKIICIQEFDKDPHQVAPNSESPVFVLHYPGRTLYVRTVMPFETFEWAQRLKKSLSEFGPKLEEQRLTHEDVPVIVDKCIKFVSTYGLTSKGIYRQSGTNSKISKLLDSFRKDAHKVHLQLDEYSEHDVANVLKRFLRTLPEPLTTKELYSKWLAAVGSDAKTYIEILAKLPVVNYQTLRKLIAHLHSVNEHSSENLMPATNLAQVFGSSLFTIDTLNFSSDYHEVYVMVDLINMYPSLFGVSAEELEKEEKIQKALRDLREAKLAQKPAGDILVGVYVYSRQWGKCLNVKLTPSMSALSLCSHAIQQLKMRDKLDTLSVYEVVCDGDLERPLHYSEMVLSVTIRWAAWADTDAKDNYLIIKKNEMFQRILPLTRQPLSMFGELKFADVKSKSFKKFMFEFKNARLAYYKDAKISLPLGSWNIEDLTWYIGSESRRPAPTQWAVSFIEQKVVVNRGSKESPFFGRTISFSCEEEFYKWISAMLTGQYPNGIRPKYEPIDLLA